MENVSIQIAILMSWLVLVTHKNAIALKRLGTTIAEKKIINNAWHYNDIVFSAVVCRLIWLDILQKQLHVD